MYELLVSFRFLNINNLIFLWTEIFVLTQSEAKLRALANDLILVQRFELGVIFYFSFYLMCALFLKFVKKQLKVQV